MYIIHIKVCISEKEICKYARIHSVVLTFYSPTPGATEFSYWVPQTEIGLMLTLMDKKFGLVCSLLLCRLQLPAAGKRSAPLIHIIICKFVACKYINCLFLPFL